MQNVFMHLRMAEHKAGETVFNFGDRGQLFYIIIEGEVEIRTPCLVELENEQVTPMGVLAFCINHLEDIFWDRIQSG
jgi:hypothetical protein